LKRKLDIYLSEKNSGKVVDIKFIPEYKTLLELERKRNEIMDIRDYISKKESSFVRRFLFPKIFRTNTSIKDELEIIENGIEEATQLPVYSSGHAFVCFDSLLSTHYCLQGFQEDGWKKLNIQMKSFWEDLKNNKNSRRVITSTFQKFEDEDLEVAMMDIEKVNILVDQLVEPYDIIWSNVGGYRGIFFFRRIFCNFLIVLILLFMTTPTV
jgi:hypothetical protein